MLVAGDAQRRGAEIEKTAAARLQAQPARRQHAQEMAAGEEQGIPVQGAKAGDDPVGAGANSRHAFAAGTAVAEELPVGPFLENLRRRFALVVAVVPLDEVRFDLGYRAKPRQFA